MVTLTGTSPFRAHGPQGLCSTSRCFKRQPGTVTQTTRPFRLLSAENGAERVTEVTAAPEGPEDTTAKPGFRSGSQERQADRSLAGPAGVACRRLLHSPRPWTRMQRIRRWRVKM